MKDKFTTNQKEHSYYPLLYMALEETHKGEVIEMGTGHGSTPLLHEYCEINKRKLCSYDHDKKWANKFRNLESDTHFISVPKEWDWVSQAHLKSASVIFIDHAPGERRCIDLLKFHQSKGIIVCHDTEPAANHGYMMRQHFPLFNYVVEIQTDGAWATALSNTIDITTWAGQKFGEYEIVKL